MIHRIVLVVCLVAVILSGLLSSCAHGPVGALPRVTSASPAGVIVVRTKNPIGMTNSYTITVDGSEIFGIRIGEYAQFALDPGKHSIGVRCFGGWSPTWKEDRKEFDFAPNAVHYFLVDPDLSCAGIEQIPEADGTNRVASSTRIPAQ